MFREKLNNKRILIPLMLVLCIFSVEESKADIYQWTDENGKIHFGDKLPEYKIKNKEILKQDNPSSLIKGSAEDIQRERKQAESWYIQRIEKSRVDDIKIKKKEKERVRENKIKQKKCEKYKKKLSDYEAQLKAKKRAGIKPSHENQMKITIEQYQRDVAHYCQNP